MGQAVSEMRGILEIGPGPGVLTGPLSRRCERLIALEIDPALPRALAESSPAAEIRPLDALQADLKAILRELPMPRAVVSNLPYYITAPLLTRIAEAGEAFDLAVLMMQKEVAERIRAPAGARERGSLSVYLQAHFEIDRLAEVPPGAFLPPPKVQSTVLRLSPRDRLPGDFPKVAFFKFVRGSFAQPRKTLRNNLLALGVSGEQATFRIERAGLSPTARPSEATLDQWLRLYEDPSHAAPL